MTASDDPTAARLAIIADDLTGACDTAIQYFDVGFPTEVLWRDDRLPGAEAEMVAWTTQTRADPPHVATQRVRTTCNALTEAGYRLVYKKIDSTLAGNLAPEIAAALAVIPASMAIVSPAFPQMGRRLIHGELRLGDDLQATGKNLNTILGQQFKDGVCEISCDQLRSPTDALIDLLRQAESDCREVVIVDATTPDDLQRLAAATISLGEMALPVGSAGFAIPLARAMALRHGKHGVSMGPSTESPDPTLNHAGRAIVLLVGSRNPVTAAQTARLLEDQQVVQLDLTDGIGVRFRDEVAAGRHIVIPITWNQQETSLLTEIISPLAGKDVGGVVLTGGDTAQLLCDLAGVEGIRLSAQLMPGIAKGCLVGGELDGLPVVTKAGGFGPEDTICRIIKHPSIPHEI